MSSDESVIKKWLKEAGMDASEIHITEFGGVYNTRYCDIGPNQKSIEEWLKESGRKAEDFHVTDGGAIYLSDECDTNVKKDT